MPNSKVTVLINNAYRSTISTDYESALKFQAPLKLGTDTISIEYNGFTTSATFIYIGELLYMFLIPLGAALFLTIRKFTTSLNYGDKLTFYFGDTAPNFDPQQLKMAFWRVSQKAKRATPGLPELVEDISRELVDPSIYGRKTNVKDAFYTCCKLEEYGIASASFGCASRSQITEELFTARTFYEDHLKSNSACSLHTTNPQKLLTANRIILPKNLSLQTLDNLSKKNDKIRLYLSSVADASRASRLVRSYSKLGATLLLLQTSSFIEMTKRFD
jgi:hypothetical protein